LYRKRDKLHILVTWIHDAIVCFNIILTIIEPRLGVMDLNQDIKYDHEIPGAKCAVSNFIIDPAQKYLYFVERMSSQLSLLT
jgi:hypothetical protein